MATEKEKINRLAQEIEKTKKSLFFFKTASLFLFLTTLAATWFLIKDEVTWPEPAKKSSPPYYQEVMKILKDLRYSGLPNFFSPDVSLKVDFDDKTWSVSNIHRFDGNGKLVLTQGRFGLCGDLSAYVFEKIRPFFDKKYDIRFVYVAESGYFLDPRASHVALSIREHSLLGSREYILDPSFGRYGPEEEFDNYQFFNSLPFLPLLVTKQTAESFPIDTHMPLIIKKGYLVSLSVNSFNGRFDKENFILTLAVTKRFNYAGRYLYAIRRADGATDVMENERLAHVLLSEEDYRKLKEKLQQIYSCL